MDEDDMIEDSIEFDGEASEIDFDALGPTGHGDICASDADPGL